MGRMLAFYMLLLAMAGTGCTNGSGNEALCESTFSPYPDLITGRVINERHIALLDGMEAYRKGDYKEAAEQLNTYTGIKGFNKAAQLYLAISYIALGEPFEAERHLDYLENSSIREAYKDQTEWYTVVCWLCSDQTDRSLAGAREIAEGGKHTYKREAEQLVAKLQKK